MPRKLNVQQDPLNSKKTRTEENTRLVSYNCGGYAFETYSWFFPYEDEEERDDYILYWIKEGWSKEQIITLLLEEDTNYICELFGDKVRVIKNMSNLEEDEIGVAYRLRLEIFNNFDFDTNTPEDCFDYDFHFRKFKDGFWTEKLGISSLRPINWEPNSEAPWISTSSLIYTGPIVFFAVKI